MAKKGEFFDHKNNLLWIRFNPNPEFVENYAYYNQVVDGWTPDVNVKTYTSGNHLSSFLTDGEVTDNNSRTGLFYCFDNDGELAGVATVVAPDGFNNRARIEYLITSPDNKNSGLTSMMVSSIISNSEFFVGSSDVKNFWTSIKAGDADLASAYENNEFTPLAIGSANGGASGKSGGSKSYIRYFYCETNGNKDDNPEM